MNSSVGGRAPMERSMFNLINGVNNALSEKELSMRLWPQEQELTEYF